MSTVPPRDAKAQRKAEKAYAKASRPWYKKKRFWLLGLIALLILAIALGGGGGTNTPANQGDSGASSQQGSQSQTNQKPIKVTSDKMIKDLESNALQASETYKGKRVSVTGPVSNIDASGAYFNLSTTDQMSMTNIQVSINDDQKAILSKLSKGKKVTVVGEVKDVGEVMGYSLQAESIK